MQAIFSRIAELRAGETRFVLATVVHSEDSTPREPGARMIVFPDGRVEGTVGGGALEKRVIEDALFLMEGGRSKKIVYDLGKDGKDIQLGMICGGKTEVLLERFGDSVKIFIFGAGHIGKKCAELCSVLKLPFWIVDDRADFARSQLFPHAAGVLLSDFSSSFSKLPIDQNSFVIIATYSHQYDGTCLEGAVHTEARYIGMIGSRRKVKTLLQRLKEKKVNVKDPRIYAPVGLDLGDNSPEEISMSILAEIIKLKSDGTARHMREMQE